MSSVSSSTNVVLRRERSRPPRSIVGSSSCVSQAVGYQRSQPPMIMPLDRKEGDLGDELMGMARRGKMHDGARHAGGSRGHDLDLASYLLDRLAHRFDTIQALSTCQQRLIGVLLHHTANTPSLWVPRNTCDCVPAWLLARAGSYPPHGRQSPRVREQHPRSQKTARQLAANSNYMGAASGLSPRISEGLCSDLLAAWHLMVRAAEGRAGQQRRCTPCAHVESGPGSEPRPHKRQQRADVEAEPSRD